MNEERMVMRYLNCKIKKIKMMHQEKKDVASCALVIGI
jgi:hypothetical protein